MTGKVVPNLGAFPGQGDKTTQKEAFLGKLAVEWDHSLYVDGEWKHEHEC
jgi:hypothetical protein